MTAIEIRAKALVTTVIDSTAKKAKDLDDHFGLLVEGFERLLVEIATGQATLFPNKSQVAQAKEGSGVHG